ncbi:MAG: DUF1624 domain-containing protein [Bacteroidetes bacterium]|nr:DUF1624 domain-containing protein [Bacteroidota bacterium]
MSTKILDHIPTDHLKRYPSIDIFRGVAIFTMLCANSAAESLAAPHSYLIRIYGSFAAPIFVFLAGFMVGIGSKKHPPLYFLKRALEIFAVAALIDWLIWRIVPFTTFDVLYLTAFGILVSAILLKTNVGVRIFFMIICFAMGPILQHFVGYRTGVNEHSLVDPASPPLPTGMMWWFKSWLVDGWFPVFPWLGFTMAGSLVYSHGAVFSKMWRIFFPLGIISFLGGITWMYYHRPGDEGREGYSELFYPAGIPYLCAALGAIIIGVTMMQFFKPRYGLQLLRYLGSASLFVYIVHSAIISFVLDEYCTNYPTKQFLILYVCFALLMITLCAILFELKKRSWWKKLPWPLHFLLGG